jgi:hypothetical protein
MSTTMTPTTTFFMERLDPGHGVFAEPVPVPPEKSGRAAYDIILAKRIEGADVEELLMRHDTGFGC